MSRAADGRFCLTNIETDPPKIVFEGREHLRHEIVNPNG